MEEISMRNKNKERIFLFFYINSNFGFLMSLTVG